MYDVSTGRTRIANAGTDLLRIIDDEIRAMTTAVAAGSGAVLRSELELCVSFAVEVATLRERLSQLLPGSPSSRSSVRLDEAAAEFLEAAAKAADRAGDHPKVGYNRAEAAKILGVSVPTVDRLIVRGLLHPSRATRRPMFTMAELERYMRETSGRIEP
jgi:hypothetical protein